MNIYRGCQHGCIYCDSRSECYSIDDFDNELLVKINAIELLEKELMSRRTREPVTTGAMSDPYTPAEEEYTLTRKALQVLSRMKFPVHITTKSNLILRDTDVLRDINKVRASVSFTITTADDSLAARIEPRAPSPSARLNAMKVLSSAGIITGVALMPVLPFIEDSAENISEIICKAGESGARFVLPWFGVTLRDRQRLYYHNRLEKLFPGTSIQYDAKFANQYFCEANNHKHLEKVLNEKCDKYGMTTDTRKFSLNREHEQLRLF